MEQYPLIRKDSAHYDKKLKARFLSARSIYYPIRPLFSLVVGLALLGFAWTPFLPVVVAVYLAASVLTDDLIMFPILGLLRAKSNFLSKRKQAKALVRVVYTLVGYVVGAALAYFVLINIPSVVAVMTMFSAAVGCGIAIYMAVAFVSALVSHALGIPPFLGVMLGLSAATYIPPLLSVNVDIIAATSLTCGFLFSYVTKQLMRLLTTLNHSHSNADGYQFMHADTEKTLAKDARLANLFKVNRNQITELRTTLIDIIQTIKKEDTFYQDLMGFRQLKTGSFKDILHLLLTAKNEKDVENCRKLLKRSQFPSCMTPIYPIDNVPIATKAFQTGRAVTSQYGTWSLLNNSEAKYRYQAAMFYQGVQSGFDTCREKRPNLQTKFNELAATFTPASPAA